MPARDPLHQRGRGTAGTVKEKTEAAALAAVHPDLTALGHVLAEDGESRRSSAA